MAWERPVLDLPGMIAGEDLSITAGLAGPNGSGQFLFGKCQPGVNNAVIHCNAVKDRPVGVIQGNSVAGDAIQVRAIGVTKVVLGAAVRAGDPVGPDASGRAVKKAETATGANYGEFVCGVMLENGAALGNIGTLLLGTPYRI